MSTAMAENNGGAAAQPELFKPLGLQESLATMLAEPHAREDGEEVMSLPNTETETDLGDAEDFGPMSPSECSSALSSSFGDMDLANRSADALRSIDSQATSSFGKDSLMEEPLVLMEEEGPGTPAGAEKSLKEERVNGEVEAQQAASTADPDAKPAVPASEEQHKDEQLDTNAGSLPTTPSSRQLRRREEATPPPPNEKTDRYGFYMSDRIHRSREIGERETRRRNRLEAKRTKKWLRMLEHWDVYQRNGKLKARIRKGIPDVVRGAVWGRLAGIAQYQEEYPALYASLVERLEEEDLEDTDIYQTIERDINRTFPKHEMFGRHNPEGQNRLRRVLHSYSLFDDELGYCQGMGFIVAMFLSYMPEEDAFYMLVRVVNRPGSHLRGLYIRSMPMVLVILQVFDGFIGQVLPKLKRKFTSEGIDPSMFATEWFVTIFTASFPFDLVTRVWDAFLSEGWKIVYRVALALLKRHEKRLLRMHFDEILTFIKRELPSEVDGEAVMSCALRINITRKQISEKLAKAASGLEMHSTDFAMERRRLEPEEFRSTGGLSDPSSAGAASR